MYGRKHHGGGWFVKRSKVVKFPQFRKLHITLGFIFYCNILALARYEVGNHSWATLHCFETYIVVVPCSWSWPYELPIGSKVWVEPWTINP